MFCVNFQKLLKLMTTAEFYGMLSQNYKALRPAALRLTQDSEEANDLIQETLVKALRNQDKFLEGTNIKAWLYTIMRNTFITHYHRIIKRKTTVDITEDYNIISTTPSSIDRNGGEEKLLYEEVKKEVDALPEMYRHPFMQYYTGFKYQEIAEEMNIPLGTVKNRIHVARKILKERLEHLN